MPVAHPDLVRTPDDLPAFWWAKYVHAIHKPVSERAALEWVKALWRASLLRGTVEKGGTE